MAWATPEYTRGRVNVAGDRLIITGDFWLQDWKDALTVINNWRASHAFPLLSMRMTLFTRARKVDPQAVVVQRLNRTGNVGDRIH